MLQPTVLAALGHTYRLDYSQEDERLTYLCPGCGAEQDETHTVDYLTRTYNTSGISFVNTLPAGCTVWAALYNSTGQMTEIKLLGTGEDTLGCLPTDTELRLFIFDSKHSPLCRRYTHSLSE